MTGEYEAAEARARQLAEARGIPWNKADQPALLAFADQEEAERHAHDPNAIQAVVAGLCIVVGGALVIIWAASGAA